MPRSSCARIVPELPRAPISAPWAIARSASARVGPGPLFPPVFTPVFPPASWPSKTASTAAAADSTVR